MSRTFHHGKHHRIRVRGIRRPTDLKRLARVLIELEAARVETEARAEHAARHAAESKPQPKQRKPRS